MRINFLMSLLLLLSAGAFGQCCQPAASPAMTGISWGLDHAQPATEHGLAPEHDLREPGGITMAHGERPAWEVMSLVEESRSLGDAARDCRKEHATAEKAHIVWEQVGS
jgi:hypothetical protein